MSIPHTTPPSPAPNPLLWLTLEHLEQGQQRLEAQVQSLLPLLETIIGHLTAAQEQLPAAPIAPYESLYGGVPEVAEPAPVAAAPVTLSAVPHSRLLRSWWTRGVVLCALALLGALPWYRLNVTASAPRGVWLRAAVPPVVERGMWVTLPAPASVRPWAPPWAQMLKQVAAIAGDQVCVQQQTLLIRGQGYGHVYHQGAHGEPLPHLAEGCVTIQPGMVFLANLTPGSLDSRYFNAVPVEVLTARMTPLLTWR